MNDNIFSHRARRMQPSAIRRMTKLAAMAGPELISFAGGMPNPITFPLEQLARIAAEETLFRFGRNLQYGMTAGSRSLIHWVRDYLLNSGIEAHSDQILLTNGSQQAIDLITEVLIDPGDAIFVEAPTYLGALAVFEKSGAHIIPVHHDLEGMAPKDLEEKMKSVPRSSRKLVYSIPNFQNPSGITLTESRRKEIAKILEEQQAYLIEDDPYREIYFEAEGKPPLPVKNWNSERVLYLGTFSKLVAPAFRTGWVLGNETIVQKIELAKEAADLCSSLLDQKILYRFCSSPDFPHHLSQLRSFYKQRYYTMESALTKTMPESVQWTRPKGGFFIWMTLPAAVDAESFLDESILQEKVSFVIGRPFTCDQSGANCLRLAFSTEDPDRIQEGIERLASLIKRKL